MSAGFDHLDWTYTYQISGGTDVVFEQPPGPALGQSPPFYDSGPGPTYQCDPDPDAPPGQLPIDCPAPIVEIPVLGPWVFDDFLVQTSATALAGSTFGTPVEPHHPPATPTLPIDYFMIDYDLRDSGGSSSATVGCAVDPLGFPFQGRARCGPNAALGPIGWYVDIGVSTPTAAIAITDPSTQRAAGRLMHASADPTTWHYQDEPSNPDSRYLFDPALCTDIRVSADVPGYHQVISSVIIHLRPLSFVSSDREITPGGVAPTGEVGGATVTALTGTVINGPFVSGERQMQHRVVGGFQNP